VYERLDPVPIVFQRKASLVWFGRSVAEDRASGRKPVCNLGAGGGVHSHAPFRILCYDQMGVNSRLRSLRPAAAREAETRARSFWGTGPPRHLDIDVQRFWDWSPGSAPISTRYISGFHNADGHYG